MIKIYHNPRCSKSRQALAFLEEAKVDFEIIKHLDSPLTSSDLKKLINKIGIKPLELIRKNEAIWKENFKGKTLTDDQIVEAMVLYPKLIERAIVEKGEKAVIARPIETIKTIL
ncbi:arsenate reductase (glutaredoxin) [Spongiivirga citrea]|uniref:Arsenate reductase (Glutaredoxin) n=1 Tax=Spongiivirga citrea TaxID=1481457 RepID=A0A6M0CI81_9FLAO|nr:arsenate reductase (glutaredoxin) [Spongiivirga citrea]NER16663.1 arsenate reductase (glutaredoxin) [Spongiivirga citrea]